MRFDPGGGPGFGKNGHFPRRNFILNFGHFSESFGKNAPPGAILEGGGPKWGPGGSKWVIFGRVYMKNDPRLGFCHQTSILKRLHLRHIDIFYLIVCVAQCNGDRWLTACSGSDPRAVIRQAGALWAPIYIYTRGSRSILKNNFG